MYFVFYLTEGSSLTLPIVVSACQCLRFVPKLSKQLCLNAHHLQEQKVILCHSPGQIQATGFCSLGTRDLFRELVEDRHEDFISVFPNIQSVVNSMRRMQVNGFAFEVVLSCHEKSDLISLLAELIEKFAGAHKFIHSVKSLCRLP